MTGARSPEDAVLIDCDTCVMRDLACHDCVVTALLGGPPGAVDVDEGEVAALGVLADSGLVPRLRLVPLHQGRGGVSRQAG